MLLLPFVAVKVCGEEVGNGWGLAAITWYMALVAVGVEGGGCWDGNIQHAIWVRGYGVGAWTLI